MDEEVPFRRDNSRRAFRFKRDGRGSTRSTSSSSSSNLDSSSARSSTSSSFFANYSVNSRSDMSLQKHIEAQRQLTKVQEIRMQFERLCEESHVQVVKGKFISAKASPESSDPPNERCAEALSEEEVEEIPEEEGVVYLPDAVDTATQDFEDDSFSDDTDDGDSNADDGKEVFYDTSNFPSVDGIEQYKHSRGGEAEDDSKEESELRISSIDFLRNYRTLPRTRTEFSPQSRHPAHVQKHNSYHHDENTTTPKTNKEEGEQTQNSSQIPIKVRPIIDELITTEENYIENLRNGIKNYGNIFDKFDTPLGLRGKKFVLLGNIEQIVDFHEYEFLPMLYRNRDDLKTLFDELTNFIDENCLYSYVLFTINKKRSSDLTEQYKLYFKDLQEELNDKLGINSFLVQPIQRLARYPLLMHQFINSLFSTGDIKYKPIIESCCKAERRMRILLTTINESEEVNDIEECNDFDVHLQGRFKKVAKFQVIDYTLRRGYPAKVFMFDKCLVYTEMRDKRLTFRGSYPANHIGIDPKTKYFKLFYQKRKMQECDFRADAAQIEFWVDLIREMIQGYAEEEKRRLQARYSKSLPSSYLRLPSSLSLFRHSNRSSTDSGISNAWVPPKYFDDNGSLDDSSSARTTWYAVA